MEADLRTLLVGDTGLDGIVSGRVYWAERPQDHPVPAVVITLISRAPVYHYGGQSNLYEDRVQIDCWARTYADAKGAARAIRSILSGYRGEVGLTWFQSVEMDGERDFRDVNEAERFFRVSLDFLIMHSEV